MAAVNTGASWGLTGFGSMQLTNERAREGKWSFAFELDGGSLSAGIPTGVIPIFPTADYEVSVHVRTAALGRARARVIATMHDAHGAPIESSCTRNHNQPCDNKVLGHAG